MNISAILVTTSLDNTESMINILNDLSGLEVFHHDNTTGKIIVIQEAKSIQDEVNGLKRIKKIPGIILAEMVQHYFGEDTHLYSAKDIENMDDQCGITSASSCIPEYLNQ